MKEFFSLLWSLVVVCAVLALAYWATRYLGQKAAGTVKSRHLVVREQILVGRDQRLMLVEVGEQIHLLGATPGGITHLGTLSPEEAASWYQNGSSEEGHAPPGFAQALRKALQQRNHRGGPNRWTD